MRLIPLQLKGDGFSVSITPEAQAQRQALVTEAQAITVVNDDKTKLVAHNALKELSAYLVLLEQSRKAVKEPVLEAGRLIDSRAKDCGEPIEKEKARLSKLIADHAAEQLRIQRDAEEKARKAREEAERLEREEALRKAQAELLHQQAVAAAAAAKTKKERAEAEAKLQAAREAEEIAEMAAEEASEANFAHAVEQDNALSVNTNVKGVKPTLDYEVVDLRALYAAFPGLCEITPKRSDILAALKGMQEAGEKVELPGLKVVERIKVSTR